MNRPVTFVISAFAILFIFSIGVSAQPVDGSAPDRWMTVTGEAAGVDINAKDEAVAAALRKAVEEACGVFLTSQTKTQDYKAVYDKIFVNTVGYVKEHTVIKTWIEDGKTYAKVKARVSTQKFEEDWAAIAHTLHQENNPRVIIAIAEAINWTTTGPAWQTEQGGTAQGIIEDFFIEKGVLLMDRQTTADVSKRDILLASINDDAAAVAALGARFKADVVIAGKASAKYGNRFYIGGQEMYQYTAALTIRAVQTDSAQVLVSKTFGPLTVNSLQRGGEEKAISKLADESAPKLLEAVVEAWRKRANVSRELMLSVSGMDFEKWKIFKEEAAKIRGVEGLYLKEIVENTAHINARYNYTSESLAEHVTSLKSIKLKVLEITASRIRLKVEE